MKTYTKEQLFDAANKGKVFLACKASHQYGHDYHELKHGLSFHTVEVDGKICVMIFDDSTQTAEYCVTSVSNFEKIERIKWEHIFARKPSTKIYGCHDLEFGKIYFEAGLENIRGYQAVVDINGDRQIAYFNGNTLIMRDKSHYENMEFVREYDRFDSEEKEEPEVKKKKKS